MECLDTVVYRSQSDYRDTDLSVTHALFQGKFCTCKGKGQTRVYKRGSMGGAPAGPRGSAPYGQGVRWAKTLNLKVFLALNVKRKWYVCLLCMLQP